MKPTLQRSIYLSKVWLLAVAVRLALWVLPFAMVKRLARRWGVARGNVGVRHPEALVWAVLHASRFVPRASCLTQALVGQVLLSRAGHCPRLRIGVARGSTGNLHAHAWVENMEAAVIGGAERDSFNPLPAIEET